MTTNQSAAQRHAGLDAAAGQDTTWCHLISNAQNHWWSTLLTSHSELAVNNASFRFDDNPGAVTNVPATLRVSWAWAASKRITDLVLGSVLLGIFLPLIGVIAAAIACSKGPALFVHRRVGHQGKPFLMYKFRSMVVDAEDQLTATLSGNPALREEWDNHQKLRNDPRVTRLGAFLRRTSLDELPQFINVLKGDMSLVGPRPTIDSELRRRYGQDAKWYLAVRPGITGLWQVSGRSAMPYARRVALDIHYVRTQSFWLELKILLRTGWVVISRAGAL